MATTLRPDKTKTKPHTKQVTQLEEIAETIHHDALEVSQAKLSTFQRGMSLSQLLQDPLFLESFKRNMADGVAKAIGASDKQVTAVYTFNPSANPDAESGDYLPLDGSIHMLALVNNASAGLEAYIASLDRALAASLRELPSPTYDQGTSVLNVILITEKDVEQRRGYAALLTSIFAPPLKVWQRAA